MHCSFVDSERRELMEYDCTSFKLEAVSSQCFLEIVPIDLCRLQVVTSEPAARVVSVLDIST